MGKQEGITLIALVVTIIVLLILAGITISLVVGQNGIITRANQAKLEQRGASVEEQANLWRADNEMADMLGESYKETDDEIIARLHGIGLLTEEEVVKLKDKENNPNREVTIGSKTISFKLEVNKAALKIKVNAGPDGVVVLPVSYLDEDFTIDWGDGIVENASSLGMVREEGAKVAAIGIKSIRNMANLSASTCVHTYTEKNKEYIVTITGTCKVITTTGFNNVTKEKIVEIMQWGETGLEYISLEDCINLVRIAEPSEKSFKDIRSFDYTFYGCSSLRNIPENLFANCPNVTSFEGTFSGCSSLTKIPERLFTNCPNVENFVYTFAQCVNLTGIAPEVWTRGTNTAENNYQGNPDGRSCFAECTKLENYMEIPNYWKMIPQ